MSDANLNNFVSCLRENLEFSLPVGFLLAFSAVSNVYMWVKLSYRNRHVTLGEENVGIELMELP
jgi:hypothetical protein